MSLFSTYFFRTKPWKALYVYTCNHGYTPHLKKSPLELSQTLYVNWNNPAPFPLINPC